MPDEALYGRWIDSYFRSWATQSSELYLSLFHSDARHMYTPFHAYMRGIDDLRFYFEEGTVKLQKDIHITHEVLAIQPSFAMVRFKGNVTMTATSTVVRVDGVIQTFLNESGLCTLLNEWWMSDPTWSGNVLPIGSQT